MPAKYKLSNSVVYKYEAKTLIVKDITGSLGSVTYEEDDFGVINAIVNDTGYDIGERNSISLFFLALIRTTSGDVDVAVNVGDPLTIDQFELKYAGDGWYVYHLISVPNILTLDIEGVEEGHVGYSIPLAQLVKLEAGEWKPITVASLKDTAYVVATNDMPVVVNASLVKTDINMRLENLRFHEDDTVAEMSGLQEEYNSIRGLLEAAIYTFRIGNKFVFQKMIEHITSNHCR